MSKNITLKKLSYIFLALSLFVFFIQNNCCAKENNTDLPAFFSFPEFKDALKERLLSTGARDTITARISKGESCVEASQDRAREMGIVVKSFQVNKKFADYGAKVGYFSGWDFGFGSLHTYSVLEIYDQKGKTVMTLYADNYLGTVFVDMHVNVNWEAENVHLVENIPPLPKNENLISTQNNENKKQETKKSESNQENSAKNNYSNKNNGPKYDDYYHGSEGMGEVPER